MLMLPQTAPRVRRRRYDLRVTLDETDAFVALAYAELRRLAAALMRGERPDHTLDPTAAANEAWMRLANEAARFDDPRDFGAAAVATLRRVLVDHARRRNRRKRALPGLRVPLDEVDVAAPAIDDDLIAVDEALQRLQELDPGKARLVELRFFGGMTVDEAAVLLGMSSSTAARQWRAARAWLQQAIERG